MYSLPLSAISLLGGAAAGVMSWVPVYPIDVIKTNLQASTGDGGNASIADVAQRLFRERGAAAFWEGLGPKLLRAVVNHAATFLLFDAMCSKFLELQV